MIINWLKKKLRNLELNKDISRILNNALTADKQVKSKSASAGSKSKAVANSKSSTGTRASSGTTSTAKSPARSGTRSNSI